MKNTLFRLAGLGALAGGMIFAQSTPAAPAQPSQHQGFAARRARFAQRMADYLNLTPEQRSQAKQIMSAARQEAAPVRQELKQNHEALFNAIKAGNDAQIDQITKAQAPLMAKASAIRAHAFEKIYATLTPEQKTKADNMQQFFRSFRGQHEHRQQSNS